MRACATPYDAIMDDDAAPSEEPPRFSSKQPSASGITRACEACAPRNILGNRLGNIVAALTLILLALWLALLLAGAIAAATIFPVARETPLALDGYQAFVLTDETQGRMLIAGVLVQNVFVFTAKARLWIALLAVSFVMLCAPWKCLMCADRVRVSASAAALIALLFGVFWAQPQFTRVDAEYRDAARAGDIEQAHSLKPAVDSAHHNASRLASLEVVALLIVIGASGASRRG